jgi:hypothetical protein
MCFFSTARDLSSSSLQNPRVIRHILLNIWINCMPSKAQKLRLSHEVSYRIVLSHTQTLWECTHQQKKNYIDMTLVSLLRYLVITAVLICLERYLNIFLQTYKKTFWMYLMYRSNWFCYPVAFTFECLNDMIPSTTASVIHLMMSSEFLSLMI